MAASRPGGSAGRAERAHDGSSVGGRSTAGATTLPRLFACWAARCEDVGAITGKTMEVLPEASSAAQDGKPAGGNTASGLDGSKIHFEVDVKGGESGYQDMLSFARGGIEPGCQRGRRRGVGDHVRRRFPSMGGPASSPRKGDAVIRVDWDPQVYPGAPADVGGRLANALPAGMYRSARCDLRG